MISHKHRCIFIHIPKAAGTSIERAFMEDLGINMENRHALLLGANTNKDDGPRRISHLSASEFVDGHYVSQELYNTYFKFSFVRNPYTRLFSTYKYLKYNSYIDFDTFIVKKLDILIKSREYGYFFKPQHEFLYYDNRIIVDFVGKMESIDADFDYVKQKLSLSRLNLKHFNRSSTKNDSKVNVLSISKRLFREYNLIPYVSFKRKELVMSKEAKDKIIGIYGDDFTYFEYNPNSL